MRRIIYCRPPRVYQSLQRNQTENPLCTRISQCQTVMALLPWQKFISALQLPWSKDINVLEQPDKISELGD